MDSLLGGCISFCLFMPISFDIVHTCVNIQNIKWPLSVRLTASNILHLSVIFVFFTSVIPYVFLVWQSYLVFANVYIQSFYCN